MKFTFYRPKEHCIAEYYNIVEKLRSDLNELQAGNVDKWETILYVYEIVSNAKLLEHNRNMAFLGLDDPNTMPHDARVEFFYLPTYISTAFMIKAALIYPELMSDKDFPKTDLDFDAKKFRTILRKCMYACTGRGFDGAGALKLKDCFNIFANAGAEEFLNLYPKFSFRFKILYFKTKEILETKDFDIYEWYY